MPKHFPKLVLVLLVDLSNEFYVVTVKQWRNRLPEVALVDPVDFCRNFEGNSKPACDLDRAIRSFSEAIRPMKAR